jgi:hypothetical protein
MMVCLDDHLVVMVGGLGAILDPPPSPTFPFLPQLWLSWLNSCSLLHVLFLQQTHVQFCVLGLKD